VNNAASDIPAFNILAFRQRITILIKVIEYTTITPGTHPLFIPRHYFTVMCNCVAKGDFSADKSDKEQD
jgi:hypothetical protein